MQDLLFRGLEKLEIPCSKHQGQQLVQFLVELERWNRAYGFVKAEGDQLILRHLLDSLTGLKIIAALPRTRSIVDVGSGAGFPGIPLSIFMPDSDFCLLERSAKRAAFLRNMVLILSLGRVRVLEQDLESLTERFDVVTFRAVTPLAREMRTLTRICLPGGFIAAYKGKRRRIDEELACLPADLQYELRPLKNPFLEEERHLVLLRP